MVRSWRACCGRRGGAGRGVSSWRVCGRRACRTSCGPRGDAGNNPCSRQGDRVVAPTDACSSSRASVWSDDPNALATRRGCRISPAPRPSFERGTKWAVLRPSGRGPRQISRRETDYFERPPIYATASGERSSAAASSAAPYRAIHSSRPRRAGQHTIRAPRPRRRPQPSYFFGWLRWPRPVT